MFVDVEEGSLLDTTRRMVSASPRAASALATAVAAGEEGDEDVEEGGDAVDDGGQDAGDTVDNGHEDVADGSEQVLNLCMEC